MPRYFIYSRRSSEDEDRQVQSIESQQKELKPIAAKLNLPVIELLSEAQSAKAPGRPVFNEMMRRINRGEADGILCWKLDRLARNPVDGGAIIWAMKQRGLVIRTPQQTFSQVEDNQILMYIEFGMAQKYIDDLSRNTMRGLKTKAEKGWYPGVAPLGYLNSRVEERGKKTILRDPKRFEAVRRMWNLMLSGNYNLAQILRIANEDWGFRSRLTKRTGGKPLGRSTLYKLFANPFYCGRYEYPRGSGKWHRGQHDAMITEAEFESVRKKLNLGLNSEPKPQFPLPLTGLLRCGDCGSTITAHFKEQVRCTKCHFKSSVKNRKCCFKCGLLVAEMKSPKIRSYAYYHCTRTLKSTCRQQCISSTQLHDQVVERIAEFRLPNELKDWGMAFIEKLRAQEFGAQQHILDEKRRVHEDCVRRIENLLKLKTAPENIDGTLLSDEEYQKQRTELLAQKTKLAMGVEAFESELKNKVRFVRQLIQFVASSNDPKKDNTVRAKEVLRALGLNHTLLDKNLVLKPEFPFSELPPPSHPGKDDFTPIEPENMQVKQGPNPKNNPSRPIPERGVDSDRTKALKLALERIWKKLDTDDSAYSRYPFADVPFPPRQKRSRGRFTSGWDNNPFPA
jgi:site-specific DNA recombinase